MKFDRTANNTFKNNVTNMAFPMYFAQQQQQIMAVMRE